MSEAELKGTLYELLSRRPWVPIRVEVADGRHTFIDTPLRVKWDGSGLVVSRFDAPTAKVTAEDVTRLVRIDELPGENGGMSYREFREANVRFRWATPFTPYEVRLTDGSSLVVAHEGQLLHNGRVGVFSRGEGLGFRRFYLAEVAAVTAPRAAGVA